MDPTKLAWLKEYLEFRSDDFENLNINSEKDFYKYIQNTGLNYGHFLNFPEELDFDTSNWPIRERNRVLFAEAFLAAVSLINENTQANLISEFQKSSDIFFQNSFKKSWRLFNLFSSKDEFKKSQKYFNRKVVAKAEWNASFFKAFLNNLLSYSDILILIKLKSQISEKEKFESEISKLHFNFATVILSVLKNDRDLTKSVSDFFIKENKFFKAKHISNDKIDDLKLDSDDNYLIRKFLLDSAVISFMAFENDFEKRLLNDLCRKIRIDDYELTSSILGADLFLIDNWDRLKYLKSRQSYLSISTRINDNLSEVLKNYESEITKIISEDEKLKNSILKTRNKHMQIEEKEKLRFALIGVLRELKPLKFIKLPINYFTFSMLLKVLPESIFPEEFNENKSENKPRTRFIDS
jgi:hypothetical protein